MLESSKTVIILLFWNFNRTTYFVLSNIWTFRTMGIRKHSEIWPICCRYRKSSPVKSSSSWVGFFNHSPFKELPKAVCLCPRQRMTLTSRSSHSAPPPWNFRTSRGFMMSEYAHLSNGINSVLKRKTFSSIFYGGYISAKWEEWVSVLVIQKDRCVESCKSKS